MKYKKVLLINPYPGQTVSGINQANVFPPLGLVYIASALRANDIQVKIVDANLLKLDNGKVVEQIMTESPDLVGISLNIVTAKTGLLLSRQIKERGGPLVCLGGAFASSLPQDSLRISDADIVVRGEGERSIVDICLGTSLPHIKGISWKTESGELVINEDAQLIDDLDAISTAAYDLLPPFSQYRSRARRLPVGYIFTSRGCPFHCTFCNHNIFGKRFRGFSPKRVVADIEHLVTKYGVRQIDILDDNFTFDMARAEAILDLITERRLGIVINLQNGIRVDNLTKRVVDKMKKAGVFKVGIGCESADADTLKEIRKGADLDKIRRTVGWFKGEGIISYLFFIIGFPNDTKEGIMRTIDFACETDPTGANFTLLLPFPGSELYDHLKTEGLLKSDLSAGIASGFTGAKMYHRCRHLTEEEVIALQALAYKKFYLRPAKIIEHLSNIRSFSELRWYLDILKEGLPVINK